MEPSPADPSELTFLAVDTRTPYPASFDGADVGKTAHYMLRWVSTTGEKGGGLPLTGRSERSSRSGSGLVRHVKGGAKRPARRWGVGAIRPRIHGGMGSVTSALDEILAADYTINVADLVPSRLPRIGASRRCSFRIEGPNPVNLRACGTLEQPPADTRG
ncbi:MAG: hypothetical protein V2A79_19190 [Planctomycetota bacterium]